MSMFAFRSCVLAVLFISMPLLFASFGQAAEFKMGVVDPQSVLEKSKAGKRALEGLKEYVSTRQKLLGKDEEELRNTEKQLKEQGDKVSADEKAAVEGPLADLKSAIAGTDLNAIKDGVDRLSASLQAFSQKLYEAAARDQNAAGTSASGQNDGPMGANGANDDDIVDAEIVDDK